MVGIGFPKAGTTYISNVLAEHPRVCFSRQKETHQFTTNWAEGLDRYGAYFEHYEREQHCIVAEWSNDYIYDPKALTRLKHTLGADVRLLISYRDPVDAVRSSLNYYAMLSDIKPEDSPRELIENDPDKFLTRFFYDEHIHAVLDRFPPEQIHVVRHHDLQEDPEGVFDTLFGFLGLAPLTTHQTIPRANVSQPYRSRRLHHLLHKILSMIYGPEEASSLMRRAPRDKPSWLQVVQRYNTTRITLDQGLEEELERRLTPHLLKFERTLEDSGLLPPQRREEPYGGT